MDHWTLSCTNFPTTFVCDCRSDALIFELLRTRWRARVIFVGWTWEPHHHTVTQFITSNTLRLNCITQSHSKKCLAYEGASNETSVAQRLEHPI